MNPTREESLFKLVLEKPAEERAAFLEVLCGEDAALKERIEALLASNEKQSQPLPSEETTDDIPQERSQDEGPGKVIGRYKLLEQIGEGGFGVVYVAEQKRPVKRRVALKIIKLGMDTKQVVARFEAERQALALMDHPNIAKVLDAGATDTGRPYFVMELVRGIPITDYCDQEKVGTQARLDLFIKICHAIQHAHQKGIIHRDIKPSNILVTLHDGIPVPKVIDFGIAKATRQDLTDKTVYTRLQQFIGTPAYMSPEQAEMSGLDVDTRSDIYSLGVLLYELLTGSTPFSTQELMHAGLDAMRKTIREKEPDKPSSRLSKTLSREGAFPKLATRHSSLATDLDWIVMKCLEKDRTRRYETANGLAADLKRHLADEPVVARPPSTAYRFQKAFRRNRLVFTAGMAVAAALVFGIGVSTWQASVAMRAEADRAEEARKAQDERDNAKAAQKAAETAQQRATQSQRQSRRLLYVADMSLVQEATVEGNLGRARSLLDRHRPKPGEDDIRGFEWRYLWAQSRSDEAEKLGNYHGFLGGLAVSPNGIYLASTGAQGIEIRAFQNRAVMTTLSYDGAGPIQFSPDGQFLLANRGSGLACWNTRTWKEALELPGLSAPFIFAQSGQHIVGLQGNHLSVWDFEKRSKVADLPGTLGPISESNAIAVSPDGNTVFFGDATQIRSWDLTTQIELKPMSYPLGLRAACLAVSPEGLLAAAHWNGQVTLWELKTHQLLQTFESHLAWVSSVAFSPDGSLLASASADQNIFLYETKSRKLLRRFKGHEGEIFALAFSRDGHWLISGSGYDKSLRLWDLADTSRERDHVEMTIPLRFVDSSRSLLCASSTLGFTRVDVRNGSMQPLCDWPVSWERSDNARGYGLSLAISPDGSRVAAKDRTLGVEIWNTLSNESEVVLTNVSGRIESVTFSEDGKRLAAAGNGSPIRLWNTTDWSFKDYGDPIVGQVNQLAFSHDGSRLAHVGNGGTVLDLDSGKSIFHFQASAVIGLALSRDGRFLAAGTAANAILLWDVDSGRQLGMMRGHVAGVLSLSFSPDGKTLASCGDSRLKLWNIETQQEILTLARFGTEAGVAMFSADGACLATSTQGGGVQLWRAPLFQEIAATEAQEKAEIKQP